MLCRGLFATLVGWARDDRVKWKRKETFIALKVRIRFFLGARSELWLAKVWSHP